MNNKTRNSNNHGNCRYLVGIDLGTTHTVVAFTDISGGAAAAKAELFEIEQLIAPGVIAKRPLLPSFRYHPAEGEVAPRDLQLPWTNDHQLPDELDNVIIGEWARELGSKVEGRLVVSAKSWLSHSQVDRSASILPWAAAEDVKKVSPVFASASYLNHVRQNWNHDHPDERLEDQEVVITIPASFDEAARALTVDAANIAGLSNILLLEEPQAVCYDWYAQNEANAEALLQDIRLLLVADVGGGTTDLSLIQVSLNDSSDSTPLALNRIGVGDHLMLGGDNVDLALAHIAEQRISPGAKKLSTASLSQLIQQTRKAKELLLSDNAPPTAKVTVLGSGSKLIGGSKSCELSKEEVRDIALDGFFPKTQFTEHPNKRRSAVVEFGLPYASDPAISKHIAEFLDKHHHVCQEAIGENAKPAIPDAILLNGGVFNSPLLVNRSLEMLNGWRDDNNIQSSELKNAHPDLAVAYGAVNYALARRGVTLKIGGGSARSYFLVLDGETAEAEKNGVCLLPKGAQESEEIRLEAHKFLLKLGQPVCFHLASSTGDSTYKAGELCTLEQNEFVLLPPLVVALDKSSDKAEVEIQLATSLTEVGTLQLDCVATQEQSQRWHVEFELRKNNQKHVTSQNVKALPARFPQAIEKIEAIYGSSKKTSSVNTVKRIRTELDKTLGARETWDTPTLREISALMIQHLKRRRRSNDHEKNWLNLCGFSLRPGFGYPTDEWSMQQLWPLYQQGLQFSKDTQNWSDWWTFWRRVAGGLDEEQQLCIYDDIVPYIDAEEMDNRKITREAKAKSYEDMVRLIATLENLPFEAKIEIGYWFMMRLARPTETKTSWWALGRVGARVPFYGSTHNVVPKEYVQDWLPTILNQNWKENQHIAFAAVMLSRMSGDRSRDIDDEFRIEILNKLKTLKAPALWIDMVSEVTELNQDESTRVFGDSLPVGLKLINN